MSIAENPGNGIQRNTGIILVAALVLAGSMAAWNVSHWPVKLRYPGEQDYVEGMRLAEMVHLRQGVPIYALPSGERFDASIYGPLYYFLGARLVDSDAPAYFPLRVLSMLATLACAAGCAVLAYWLSGSRFAALLAPLIFLSYRMVTAHGLSLRCDIVALGLFLGGFLMAFRLRASPRIWMAAPLMLAGIFYKQQFVSGPIAVFLFLILERRYRQAAVFSSLLGGGFLGLLALFEFVVFRGENFFQHAYHYNVVSFSLGQFQAGLLTLGFVFLVPILVGVEALKVRREKLVFLYLLASVVLALTALGKVGSLTNYFLEIIWLGSALFAATFALRVERGLELLVLLAFALFLGQFLTLPNPVASDFERDRAIQGYLRRNFPPKTPALGYYAGDLIRAGLDVPTSDIYQYSKLIRKGTLSDRDLIGALDERRFKLVVLTCDIEGNEPEPACVRQYLTPRLAARIRRNYRVARILELPSVERLGPEQRFFAWVPKPDSERGLGGK